jgi:thioesterase domain-containing protein
MLATAMACELQQAGRQQALLVLLDGPAAHPAMPLHDPASYALHQLCRDLGTCTLALPNFVRDVSRYTDTAEQLRYISRQYRHAPVAGDAPAHGEEDGRWDAAVVVALHRASVIRRLQDGYLPEYIFSGPATLLLPEDALGAAFLAAIRQCCAGPLSYSALECGHTQVLAAPGVVAAVAACVSDAALSMLSML